MLKVRKEQKEVFSERERRGFEDRLFAGLGAVFPARCEALGEPAVRGMIRDGVARAARYGLISERGASIFVTAMVALGPSFDADPALPWARSILTDRSIDGPILRAEELLDAVTNHLDAAEEEEGAAV